MIVVFYKNDHDASTGLFVSKAALLSINRGGVMKAVFKTVSIAMLVLVLLTGWAQGGEATYPFAPGEKLTFDLKWGSIGAGEAVLWIMPMKTINGQPAYHFLMTARSNKTIDRIFRIRDRLESYADHTMTHSLLYKQNIREGGYHRNHIISFDWEKGEARYHSGKGYLKNIKIRPGTFDPLAAFYFVRLQPMDAVTKFFF